MAINKTIIKGKTQIVDGLSVGSETTNTGLISLNVSNAGSPQIEISDNTGGDTKWAVGTNDGDNSFVIHGDSLTMPTVNNISNSDFEITIGGTLKTKGNTIINTADVTESATGSKIVKRDSSGNINVKKVSATSLEVNGAAITATPAELNKLDGFTGDVNDLNYLKSLNDTGVTSAEFNTLDGITSTVDELNKLDGFTGTYADLNYAKSLNATGVTAAEFDTALDGITATAAELNHLDGITSTVDELNKLDGFTGDATDLNYAKSLYDTEITATEFTALDGVRGNIQVQIDNTNSDTSLVISNHTIDKANPHDVSRAQLGVDEDDEVIFAKVTAPLTGNVTGNADTATKLKTARTIDITGDITATAVAFDGTKDIAISASVNNNSHTHTSSNISDATNSNTANMIVKRDSNGGFSAGTITANQLNCDTIETNNGWTVKSSSAAWHQKLTSTDTSDKSIHRYTYSEDQNTGTYVELFGVDGYGDIYAKNRKVYHTGNIPTWNQNTTGNAATATKLKTARTITLNGDVSGSTTFDGSGNKTITTVVANNSHTHTSSNISDATNSNTAKMVVKRDEYGGFAAGTITATTQASTDNSTKVATTAYTTTAVNNAISSLIDASPDTLDTLNELAASLGDDSDFAGTMTTALATKLNKSGGTMTGGISMGNNEISGVTDLTTTGIVKVGPSKLQINNVTVTSTADELNKLDGFTGTYTDLNYAKELHSTGVTSAEFNTLDGITSTVDELNKLDGFTGDVNDLNYLKSLNDTGVTATEFNNVLDGNTTTASEINTIRGTGTVQGISKGNSPSFVKVTANLTGNVTGNLTGNAGTATKLATARTITLSGDVSGSTTFDGSGNKTITTTVANNSHTHTSSNISDATNNNTANMVVKRSSDGSFNGKNIEAEGYLKTSSEVKLGAQASIQYNTDTSSIDFIFN